MVVTVTEPRPWAQHLRASSTSPVPGLAGTIAGAIRAHGKASVRAVGAGAINQAIKALAVAQGFVAAEGVEIIAIPSFTKVELDDGQSATAIVLSLEARKRMPI